MGSPEQPPGPPSGDPLAGQHADLDREEKELMRLKLAVPGWLRDNPGLCLTVIYLFASVVGMVFHSLLLKRFGFNALEFSETSDFLMVVVREPLAVALALLGVPFYLVYTAAVGRAGEWARRKTNWLRASPEKRRKTIDDLRRMRPWIQAAFICVWAVVFVQYYSLWRSRQIRAGDFRKVTVHYKTDSPAAGGALSAEGLAVLGTTSRYVFFYDPATKRSEVVPLDAIARLVWDARTRREKAADAAK
jgi:hypothetical protein